MDMSGFAILPLACLCGIVIPAIATGTIYGLTILIREITKRQFSRERITTILVITSVIAFIFSCAVFWYVANNTYVM
jgi:hypothetical protein